MTNLVSTGGGSGHCTDFPRSGMELTSLRRGREGGREGGRKGEREELGGKEV